MKTTRESAREESHKKVTHDLQELLEKNYDAEKDYRTARERAESKSLKEFFKKQAVRRNHFATEIDKELHSLNEHPKDSGSTVGKLKRTWINLKTSLGKDADKVLLEECLRGEKNSLEEYEKKLKMEKYPAKIEELLRRHILEIEETISEIKSLEDFH
ncbi:ferritin-like domain-containing protein [Salinimicrobium sp. TH3]|uniref:ferritin-like domain-containing protein n=1 Tax=Salinimicrobium sp. TH3 TaxID=2997342 RepID=UPI002275212B|nr:PA2169 family four-helix-bundle protein [Salinimicrobium sp. TH3]MCY2687058.1 PA2169 family four-helix-bundle protein [Salinimicrobium sp. TH3]